MRRFFTVALSLLLAAVTAAVMPAQVFAGSKVEYISEVKVGMGNKAEKAKTALEGYRILSDDKGNPVDLNQGAGGGWGSKGEKVVYLGYKTTTDSKEAITDLALMNMKGGYDVAEYDALMEQYMDSQIKPFVNNFIKAVQEYRINYNSDNPANAAKAKYVHDLLNKYTDDDCGDAPLGDLLLNETKFEMGDKAYNALSENEKKKHCDILALLAQSNGHVTLMLENLITRASDTGDNTWFDRFNELTYDDLADSMGIPPTDARRELARLYDDDAQLLLNKWDAFQSALIDYEAAQERLDNYDEQEVADAYERFTALNGDSTQEEIDEATVRFNEAQKKESQMLADNEILAIREYLADIEYSYDGEETAMLDFFSLDYSEIEENQELLYPLIASLSDGQRAGLEFVTLPEMIEMATTDPKDIETEIVEDFKPVSVYDGVNREIYQKGGVALTSDALRDKVVEETMGSKSLSGGTIAMIVISGIVTAAFIASVGVKVYFMVQASSAAAKLSNLTVSAPALRTQLTWTRVTSLQNSKFMNGFCRGLGVAAVVLAAITVYLSYRDMVNYYKVDFTPIPHYMVDAKDIIGYNSKGEKIVIKNQSAYYQAVECNRKKSDEFYETLDTCADMNGDVGKQWLALYSVKNEAMDPILASSLKVVVGSSELPAGYTTGIHMFGSNAAFNLNSNLYDWNNSAKSIFVFFKVDDTAKANLTGSNFSFGALALTGGAGLVIGSLITKIGAAVTGKRKKEA